MPEINNLIEIGRIVGSTALFAVAYQKIASEWELRILVSTGGAHPSGKQIQVKANTLSLALSKVRDSIFSEFRLQPLPADSNNIDAWFIPSDSTIEILGNVYLAGREGQELGEILRILRRAVLSDPKSIQLRQVMASALISRGDYDEAIGFATAVCKAKPDYALSRVTLGLAYRSSGFDFAAQSAWEKAIELDPNSPIPFTFLGAMYADRKNFAKANQMFESASRIAPYDPTVWAGLAKVNALRGDRDRARIQNQIARKYERFDPVLSHTIGKVDLLIGDFARARRAFRRSIALARQSRLSPIWIAQMSNSLALCEPQLVTRLVHANRPQDFSIVQLQQALHECMTWEEKKRVPLPFVSDQRIDAWSASLFRRPSSLTETATNVFAAVCRGFGENSASSRKDVAELFDTWRDTNANAMAQNPVFLYLAIARKLNLPAFYVWVDQDYQSERVSHVCVGVFVDEGMLLVDPVYEWFGVPHKQFRVLSDMEAVQLYLSTQLDRDLQDIAMKLGGDWDVPYFLIALNRFAEESDADATIPLKAGLKLNSDSWLACLAKGADAVKGASWKTAIKELEECLALKGNASDAYYYLGLAYRNEGMLSMARDKLRQYLHINTLGQFNNVTRYQLQSLDGTFDDYSSGSERRPSE